MNNKVKSVLIHRLVAKKYGGNASHAIKMGTFKTGENCAHAKLKNSDVDTIREMLRNKKRVPDIAKSFGVHPQTIWAIKHKRSWNHYKGPISD